MHLEDFRYLEHLVTAEVFLEAEDAALLAARYGWVAIRQINRGRFGHAGTNARKASHYACQSLVMHRIGMLRGRHTEHVLNAFEAVTGISRTDPAFDHLFVTDPERRTEIL